MKASCKIVLSVSSVDGHLPCSLHPTLLRGVIRICVDKLCINVLLSFRPTRCKFIDGSRVDSCANTPTLLRGISHSNGFSFNYIRHSHYTLLYTHHQSRLRPGELGQSVSGGLREIISYKSIKRDRSGVDTPERCMGWDY